GRLRSVADISRAVRSLRGRRRPLRQRFATPLPSLWRRVRGREHPGLARVLERGGERRCPRLELGVVQGGQRWVERSGLGKADGRRRGHVTAHGALVSFLSPRARCAAISSCSRRSRRSKAASSLATMCCSSVSSFLRSV